jgi:Flp pilus assembly pilin Flp
MWNEPMWNELMKRTRDFLGDCQGQDLIEYSLLLAFVTLASAGLYINSGGAVQGIWTAASAALSAPS